MTTIICSFFLPDIGQLPQVIITYQPQSFSQQLCYPSIPAPDFAQVFLEADRLLKQRDAQRHHMNYGSQMENSRST
jgi:hypothetical protein